MTPPKFSQLPLMERVAALADKGSMRIDNNVDELLVVDAAFQGRSMVIISQRAELHAGTIGAVQVDAWDAVLGRLAADRPDILLVLPDSGGVRLHEGNRGMSGLARIVTGIVDLRRRGTTCVAVIAGPLGCYGGATLIAGACDRVIMARSGHFSLSGPKVLQEMQRVQGKELDLAVVKDLTLAEPRLHAGDVDMLVDDDAGAITTAIAVAVNAGVGDRLERAALAARAARRRLRDYTHTNQSVPDALPGVMAAPAVERMLDAVFPSYVLRRPEPGIVAGHGELNSLRIPILGASGELAIGVVHGTVLLEELLSMVPRQPPCVLLLADFVQAFQVDNERYGYAQVLGALAQVLCEISARQCPVIGYIRHAGSAATMVAAGMCGVELYAASTAQIHPLPPNVVARFIGDHVRDDIDAAPDPGRFARLGAVRAVWPEDHAAARLRDVLQQAGGRIAAAG